MYKRLKLAALSALVLSGLSACYLASAPLREETALRLASAAHMLERHVEVDGFDITLFERATKRNAPARIYIDGDGPLWLMGEQVAYEPLPSNNPTPVNPVALHLATHDNALNKFYIGRPCHYLGGHRPSHEGGCPSRIWHEDRYSPEVIDVMSGAIDAIKKRYDITTVELVGFNGGGVIALALALKRDDITNVRTVAAPLDHNILTASHEIPAFSGSVNPPEFAARIAQIPQVHFYGHLEEDIPYEPMYDSYAAAAGSTQCMQFHRIKRASDDKGWVNNWPKFLNFPIDCKNP